jgi:anhydro-N-acetylmuramic acid kinase
MSSTIDESKAGYHVIGCMSGSSLDGLDLALCRFTKGNDGWSFKCLSSDTVKYNSEFSAKFIRVMHGTALDAARLHQELGIFIGQSAAQMALDHHVDLIASHGHTLFHLPQEGLTHQIGCGAHIAAISGIPTVVDFRTADTALGGQGAPLVPVGELALFPEYRSFLNLGGIANVSNRSDRLEGFDICPCNQILNALAWERGVDYDSNGDIARTGSIDEQLLKALEELPFYEQEPPKSLGREWFEQEIRPLFDARSIGVPDKLATAVEHIARMIARDIERSDVEHLMVTGGGAFNAFLIGRIRAHTRCRIDLPEKEIISFKEAIIFAFLGLLRYLEHPNIMASVTGAEANAVGGGLYLPPSTI